MKTLLLFLTLALLAGCNTGRIKTPNGVTLYSPKDASAPSSVKEGQKSVKTTIPAGTVVVRENIEATPQSPAIERETTSYTQPAEKVETETKTDISVAAPRAPDQAVALRNADNKARAPLLYAVIVGAVITGILIYAGKIDAAVASGSIAAALGMTWYAYGSPLFMAAAIVLVVLGVGFLIWRQHNKAQKTTEALRRTVQTVEELKIDQPAMAKEIMDYQSSNLDSEHKTLLQDLQHTINDKYLREQLALRYIDSK
jgi:hypothetical protein